MLSQEVGSLDCDGLITSLATTSHISLTSSGIKINACSEGNDKLWINGDCSITSLPSSRSIPCEYGMYPFLRILAVIMSSLESVSYTHLTLPTKRIV